MLALLAGLLIIVLIGAEEKMVLIRLVNSFIGEPPVMLICYFLQKILMYVIGIDEIEFFLFTVNLFRCIIENRIV